MLEGTDLLSCLRDDIFPVEKIVSLSRLDGLRGNKGGAGRWNTDRRFDYNNRSGIPSPGQGSLSCSSPGSLGSREPSVRNQGTIGGNLCQKPHCWYYVASSAACAKGETNVLQ